MFKPLCEDCKRELTLQDAARKKCECGFPLSKENRDKLVKMAGLESADRPDAPDVSLSSPLQNNIETKVCNNAMCGYLFGGDDIALYESGGPCPSCDKDPRADDVPEVPSFSHNSGLPAPPPPPVPTPDSRGEELGDTSHAIVSNDVKSSDTLPDEHICAEVVIGEMAGKIIILPTGVPLGRKEFKSILGSRSAFQYEKISGKHVQFDFNHVTGGSGFDITDLGSTNGTVIDGERIEPNKRVGISKGSRISLAKRGLVLRYTSSSFDADEDDLDYQIIDPTTGVSFRLTNSKEEIFGRDPEGNGTVHQFIDDLFSHAAMAGLTDEISNQLQTVSRKHVGLRVEGGELTVTNYSTKGTIIHEIGSEEETLLQDVGEIFTADLSNAQVIRTGKLHFHFKLA